MSTAHSLRLSIKKGGGIRGSYCRIDIKVITVVGQRYVSNTEPVVHPKDAGAVPDLVA